MTHRKCPDPPYSGGRNQTPKMAAASEERMAEEGGGGHGDGGSCSAASSAQRQPPTPPSQALQPGSQAPAAPALAPDHLPQNNTLVALPIVAIENILSFMSYDEISQLRLVRLPRDPASAPPGPRSGEGGQGQRVPGEGAPAGYGHGVCSGRREVSLATVGPVLLHWHPDCPAAEAPCLEGLLVPSLGRARLREVTELGLVPLRPAGGTGIPEGTGACPP